MNASEFCYWLQGHFELADKTEGLTEAQVRIIKAHLNLVFKHDLDKRHGSEQEQAELNAIHEQGKPAYALGKPPAKQGAIRC